MSKITRRGSPPLRALAQNPRLATLTQLDVLGAATGWQVAAIHGMGTQAVTAVLLDLARDGVLVTAVRLPGPPEVSAFAATRAGIRRACPSRKVVAPAPDDLVALVLAVYLVARGTGALSALQGTGRPFAVVTSREIERPPGMISTDAMATINCWIDGRPPARSNWMRSGIPSHLGVAFRRGDRATRRSVSVLSALRGHGKRTAQVTGIMIEPLERKPVQWAVASAAEGIQRHYLDRVRFAPINDSIAAQIADAIEATPRDLDSRRDQPRAARPI